MVLWFFRHALERRGERAQPLPRDPLHWRLRRGRPLPTPYPLKVSWAGVPQVTLNLKLSAHYRPQPFTSGGEWRFLARCQVGWLIFVSEYRLGLQTRCCRHYILQASLDKNAAQDSPKHAISDEKFKNMSGEGAQPQCEGGQPFPHLTPWHLQCLDREAVGIEPLAPHSFWPTFGHLPALMVAKWQMQRLLLMQVHKCINWLLVQWTTSKIWCLSIEWKVGSERHCSTRLIDG